MFLLKKSHCDGLRTLMYPFRCGPLQRLWTWFIAMIIVQLVGWHWVRVWLMGLNNKNVLTPNSTHWFVKEMSTWSLNVESWKAWKIVLNRKRKALKGCPSRRDKTTMMLKKMIPLQRSDKSWGLMNWSLFFFLKICKVMMLMEQRPFFFFFTWQLLILILSDKYYTNSLAYIKICRSIKS